MGKEGDLGHFEWGVFDDQELLIYWNFHFQPALRFTENGPKNRRHPVSSSCAAEKVAKMAKIPEECYQHLFATKN